MMTQTPEKRIHTREELLDTLSCVVFNRSVMDFHWQFEIQDIEVKLQGDATFFDASTNQSVTASNPVRKGWLIWGSFDRPDITTGESGRGRGRDEIIWEGWTESAVVKTAWVVVNMLVQHELMEGFTITQPNGSRARIFNPHNTIAELASIQNSPQHVLTSIPSTYGDHMTTQKFYEGVEEDAYTTDDGEGVLATTTEMSDLNVFDYHLATVPPQFTHVVWFNS